MVVFKDLFVADYQEKVLSQRFFNYVPEEEEKTQDFFTKQFKLSQYGSASLKQMKIKVTRSNK